MLGRQDSNSKDRREGLLGAEGEGAEGKQGLGLAGLVPWKHGLGADLVGRWGGGARSAGWGLVKEVQEGSPPGKEAPEAPSLLQPYPALPVRHVTRPALSAASPGSGVW